MALVAERPAKVETGSTVREMTIDWRFILPSQVLMAIAWVGVLRVYGDHHALVFACTLAASALGVFGVSLRPATQPLGIARPAFLAAVYATLGCAIGGPGALALFLLAASQCARACLQQLPVGQRLAASLHFAGVGAICQWFVALGLQYVVLRARYWPLVSDVAAMALEWLGLSAASVDGILYLNSSTQLLRVTPSVEKLGLLYIALLLAGLAPWLAVIRPHAFFYARLTAATLAFVVWRYVTLVSIYAQTQLVDGFWDPVGNAAFLAVFAFVIYTMLPPATTSYRAPDQRRASRSEFAGSLGLSAGIAAAALWAICFDDPGTRKHGRVIVDESHSDWEWTQRAFDTTWYGDKAGYNYATMFDHLSNYYDMSRNEKATINDRLLHNCDVLILKTPTRPYSAEELEAIVAFVRRGGGLYLIGDHTNVFGMTTYLNTVASRFGFTYGYDATYDLATGALQQYMPPPMLRDPTIIHLPSKFLFGTSCSLHPAWRSRVAICGYGIRGLYLDYSRKGFFPEGHLETSMDFGWIAQAISQHVGRGRVAAFTDSTIFSNFWYFIPGKNELFLGTVEWLNRSNTIAGQATRWAPLALAFAAWLACRKRAWSSHVRASLAPAIVGGCAAMLAADHLNKMMYAWPPAKRPVRNVAFDRKFSQLNIPAYELPGGPRSFHTFYTWVQRLGYVPKATDDALAKPEDVETLIMVYPRDIPTARQRLRLRRWVEAGGTLVVLDGFNNPTPIANQWLAEYGLRLDYGSRAAGEIEDLDGKRWTSAPAVRVLGGTPFLYARFNPPLESPLIVVPNEVTRELKEPAAAAAAIGRGRVLALGLADSFQDSVMGTTKTVPNESQKELYELEYALLRSLTKQCDGAPLPVP